MADILDLVKTQKAQSFAAGETLIHEGLTLGKLFVLAEGQVEVIRRDQQVDPCRRAGSVFGEMSVLLDQPYSATVKALSDVRARDRRRVRVLEGASRGGAGAVRRCWRGGSTTRPRIWSTCSSRRRAAAGPRRGRPDSRGDVPKPGEAAKAGRRSGRSVALSTRSSLRRQGSGFRFGGKLRADPCLRRSDTRGGASTKLSTVRLVHLCDLAQCRVQYWPIVPLRVVPDRLHFVDEHRARKFTLEVGVGEVGVDGRLQCFERLAHRVEGLGGVVRGRSAPRGTIEK